MGMTQVPMVFSHTSICGLHNGWIQVEGKAGGSGGARWSDAAPGGQARQAAATADIMARRYDGTADIMAEQTLRHSRHDGTAEFKAQQT